MSLTRLILVRHGESAAQAGGFLAGHEACSGLSDLGRSQAAALADRLSSGELGPVAALYASEMERAIETASIIGPAIGHAEPRIDCGVCELHPGDADGLTWAEIEERWPTRFGTGWDPNWHQIANAESWGGMRDRVSGSLARIAAAHAGETVVVACHGGVIAHAMQHHLGIATDADVAWLVATNTSMTEFVLDETLADWRQGRWGIARFNDAAHVTTLR
ncbi:histidine phosphatase family protein [Actinospongicola halichondriae]|uniref:histidine phosphatase family protein n=1 Tax=Actinospongicola halichondriae TaxID=3236844 RepID=UPI003D582042